MPVNNRFCLAVLGLSNTFLFSDGLDRVEQQREKPFRNRCCPKNVRAIKALGSGLTIGRLRMAARGREDRESCPERHSARSFGTSTDAMILSWHQSDWKWRICESGCGGVWWSST